MRARHCAIINDESNVFTSGNNFSGQLGIGNYVDQISPTKIETLPSIVSTSVGEYFTLFLDDKGFVWTSGYIPCYTVESNVPMKIDCVENIIKISSGKNHCLLLDGDGNVFSFGSNRFNQLGRQQDQGIPTKIENIPKIKSVHCGHYASILIDIEGNCFFFGFNNYKQLGLSNAGKKTVEVPTKIENLPAIRSVSIGEYNVFFISVDGLVYIRGNCKLGSGQIKFEGLSEQPIIKTVYLNDNNSNILRDIDNNFWALGKDEWFELSFGSVLYVQSPVKITNIQNIASVICYQFSNIFINVKGECFISGYLNGKSISSPIKMEDSTGCPIKALVLRTERFNKIKNARN